MEFEKGKYYEFDFKSKVDKKTERIHFIGIKAYNSNKIVSIKRFGYGWEEGEKHLLGHSIRPANTFDNIHEVSKRIKEIEERKDWPVQVGQIYETKGSDNHGSINMICKVISVDDLCADGDFDGTVTVLKNIDEPTGLYTDYKEGNDVETTIIKSESTLLTQEQYEQRVKELEKEEFEVGSWIVYNGFVYRLANSLGGLVAVRPEVYHKSAPNQVSTGFAPDLSKSKLLTEQEALKIFTGKDYLLLEDSQEEQIKELQEKNKQLREALVYHGVWLSEDQRTVGNYNEALEKPKGIESDTEYYNEAVTIIDQVETIHKIVLQLKEKFLS